MITPTPNEPRAHHRARVALVARRHDQAQIAAVREALATGDSYEACAMNALGACVAIVATDREVRP